MNISEIPWQLPTTLALAIVLLFILLGISGYTLTGLTNEPISLTSGSDVSAESEKINTIARAICGAINRNFDSGKPYLLSSQNNCENFCRSVEDNACAGLLMISNKTLHTAQAPCNYKPTKNYFEEQNVFCCCR